MNIKKVKDLMVPISDYAVVNKDASLYDALLALEEAQKKLPEGRQPHRAILVLDRSKNVIGKIGHLAFVKALEPGYEAIGDVSRLGIAELNADFIETIKSHYNFFQESFEDICQRAFSIKAKDVMHPLKENIDENESLGQAMHKIIIWQRLSVLVTRRSKPVGLLRLSDIFDEIKSEIKKLAASR